MLFKEEKKAEESSQSPPKGINDKEIEALEKKYQQDIKEMLSKKGKMPHSSGRLSDRLKE